MLRSQISRPARALPFGIRPALTGELAFVARAALLATCVLVTSGGAATPSGSEQGAEGAPASAEQTPGLTFEGAGGDAAPGAGLHVVLVAGDEEYRSEEALPQLAKILAQRHGFRCTVLWSLDPETGVIDPEQRGNLPGLEVLDEADMLVLFTRFRRLPDADMAHIARYVESGKPLLGIRTATHAFAYEDDSKSPYAKWTWNAPEASGWPGGFGRQVLGETWVNHHGQHGVESTRGVVIEVNHPLASGVEDVWGPTDVYGVRNLPQDAVVIVEGAVLDGMTPDAKPTEDHRNGPRMPIVWVRERDLGEGVTQRVVCSTIGASQDLSSAGVRRLFVNAVYWGVGREDRIDPERSVAIVGEYEPTPFGFGGFVKGRRPESYAPTEGN